MRTKWQKVIQRSVLILILLSLSGCILLNQPVEVKVASANVARDPSPVVDQNKITQQVGANNDFAFDLYHALSTQPGNLFYSPYSISTALAMVYAGARGETGQQMAHTLHFVLPQAQLHPTLNALDQAIQPAGGSGAEYVLHMANSIWGQNSFPFLPDFLTLIARNYGAGLRLVDFSADNQREATRQTINQWVSQQTQDKIKDLLAPDMLNANTRLVLVNAIYFKGDWKDPFDRGTADAPFTLLNGSQVTVPTMSRRVNTPYFKGDGYQAVSLAYQGERVEMVVLVPDGGIFTQFESGFQHKTLDETLAGLQSTYLSLYMPKFEYNYTADLVNPLSQLGMPSAFDRQKADFSGIFDRAKESQNLFISHVAHKAFVAVDEKGTEAAAATGAMAEITAMPYELHINLPFLFVIRDRQTGSILFVGRVLNPKP